MTLDFHPTKCHEEINMKIRTIQYYDRQTKQICQEKVMGDAAIKWAYQSLSGQAISRLLFRSSLLSRLMGLYFDSPLSRGRINRTIADLGINESEFAKPKDEYRSFNEFFTRKLKDGTRPYSMDDNHFLSPADGRLLVYPDIDGDTALKVKGVEDTLTNLFGRRLPEFDGGQVAVVRLCPADYHWFHFPCDGEVIEQVEVKGQYHSVNPVALAAQSRIFCLNKRAYSLIETANFGQIAFMEVGAFGVAGIHQQYQEPTVKRMQAKGYFDFGGSTVVLVFQQDVIKFDDDLIENSAKGIETYVKVGQTIAARN